jgi:hypothetical protein
MRQWLFLILSLAGLGLVGCGTSAPPQESAAADHLRQIKSAYGEYLAKQGKAPRSANDLVPFLISAGGSAATLNSPDDQQPFVLLWTFDPNEAMPVGDKPPVNRVWAHEAVGTGGQRWVLFVDGTVRRVAQAQFEQLAKAEP